MALGLGCGPECFGGGPFGDGDGSGGLILFSFGVITGGDRAFALATGGVSDPELDAACCGLANGGYCISNTGSGSLSNL